MAKNGKWDFPMPYLLTTDPKILIWQRNVENVPERNSSASLIKQLARLAIDNGATPVIVGQKHEGEGAINLGDFWNHDFFNNGHNLVKQLWFQHKLFTDCGVQASLGMMSGVIDGASMFFGHKTIFFANHEHAKNRMSPVADLVPGLYHLKASFNQNLTTLNETQLNTLESLIWPIS
jgi:hypothetical protein